MEILVSIMLILVFALILVLAVAAIIRGRKAMKMSKGFEPANKKVKVGYWLTSAIHMWAGILIVLFYVIAGVLILTQL